MPRRHTLMALAEQLAGRQGLRASAERRGCSPSSVHLVQVNNVVNSRRGREVGALLRDDFLSFA